jgi:homoserine kinase
MCRSDPWLVGDGMHDEVVTPARAALISGYETVEAAAHEAGATGVTVSGAGPSVLAVPERGRGRAVAAAMLDAFADVGVDARAYRTRIGKGATVV